jgi:predicted trehalose synthase
MNDMTLPEVEQLRRENESLRHYRTIAEDSRNTYRRERDALGSALDDVLSALLDNDPAAARKLAESAVAKWARS